MKTLTCLLLFLLTSKIYSQTDIVNEKHLTKVWKTEAVFDTPESVCYDASNKVLYVSNVGGNQPWVKDGVGSISKLSLKGELIEKDWVKDLNCPKGMGISEGHLYVADMDEVIKIHIESAKVVKKIKPKGAENLNDITVDNSGKVYVADSRSKKIFVIENDKVQVFNSGESFKRPNGLLALKDRILIADGEDIVQADKNGDISEWLTVGEGVDGIGQISDDKYIYSVWSGKVYVHQKDQHKKLILEYKDEKKNAADIWYMPEKQLLFIPTFFTNSVVCYKVDF